MAAGKGTPPPNRAPPPYRCAGLQAGILVLTGAPASYRCAGLQAGILMLTGAPAHPRADV